MRILNILRRAKETFAKTCEFGELTNSLIQNRIIIGMKDYALRQIFLQESTDR